MADHAASALPDVPLHSLLVYMVALVDYRLAVLDEAKDADLRARRHQALDAQWLEISKGARLGSRVSRILSALGVPVASPTRMHCDRLLCVLHSLREPQGRDDMQAFVEGGAAPGWLSGPGSLLFSAMSEREDSPDPERDLLLAFLEFWREHCRADVLSPTSAFCEATEHILLDFKNGRALTQASWATIKAHNELLYKFLRMSVTGTEQGRHSFDNRARDTIGFLHQVALNVCNRLRILPNPQTRILPPEKRSAPNVFRDAMFFDLLESPLQPRGTPIFQLPRTSRRHTGVACDKKQFRGQYRHGYVKGIIFAICLHSGLVVGWAIIRDGESRLDYVAIRMCYNIFPQQMLSDIMCQVLLAHVLRDPRGSVVAVAKVKPDTIQFYHPLDGIDVLHSANHTTCSRTLWAKANSNALDRFNTSLIEQFNKHFNAVGRTLCNSNQGTAVLLILCRIEAWNARVREKLSATTTPGGLSFIGPREGTTLVEPPALPTFAEDDVNG